MMLKRIVSMGMVTALAAGWACGDVWSNSLKPKGNPGEALTLVNAGKAVYSIVLPANATEVEKQAANDLQHWVTEITGATLPIVKEAASDQVIRIETDPTFEPEEYRIAEQGKRLVLSGSAGRGVMDAVYALLEEDLGCRWYTKTDTRLPHEETLTVVPVERTYVPQLKMRDPFYFVSFDADWSLHNRTNAPDAHVPEEDGGRVDYAGLFVHTEGTLLPPDKYFKEHPEYYQMNPDGKRAPVQLCTSNADVRRLVTEQVLETLKKNPHAEVVSVSRLDVMQVCHCPDCEKRRKEEGSEMANQLLLVNQVADAVAREYPGVMVDTLAYLETLPVPKTMRPRKNVIIRICNDVAGAWSHPFTPAEKTGTASYVSAWSKACDHLSIWDYNVNFSHYLAPMPNMDVIAANIAYWTKNKAWGVMTQGGYQGMAERDELKSWVIAKLMWDPSRDVDALVKDFIEGHYREAAPALEEYEALLAKEEKDHAAELASPPGGIRYPMSGMFLTKDFLDQAEAIFAKAKQQAWSAGTLPEREELLRRVERAELPILYVKLCQGVSGKVLAEFDRVAHREGATHASEAWPANMEPQIATWKAELAKKSAGGTPASRATTQNAEAHQVISKGPFSLTYQAFPDVCRLKNGDLLAVFYAGYTHVSFPAGDVPMGGRICMVRSLDDGRNWSSPEVLFDDVNDNRDPSVAQLDDGTVVCTFFSTAMKGAPLKSSAEFNWKLYHERAQGLGAQIVYSHDNGHTWDKSATTITKDWYCSSPVRQLKDGTCLLGLYRESPEKKGDFNVAWGGVTRSTDHGKTWSEPVAIGKDAKLPLDAETDVIPLKDGTLLAALRSSKVDMHYATSNDEGKTWSVVKDIGFKAQCPYLFRMSSGEILLGHRVPNTSIHMSRDEGKTWQGPYEIDKVIGAYPSMVELQDHSVLIVYYSEGKGSEIRARRFKVTADGIEFLAAK